MSKIHVWIGKTSKDKESFSRYFEINPSERDAGTGASQFDKDVNIKWYDDDLIGVYYDENYSLETLIDELPISPEVQESIQARCIELEIKEANAMFYYEDADLTVSDVAKKYNDLTYIGSFDNG